MDIFRCLYTQIALALLLFTHTSSTEASAHEKNTGGCTANERSAIVGFKAGLSDPGNRLSSWSGEDCCRWKGVQCSNRTGHVIKLDLNGLSGDRLDSPLGGNISSSLLGLPHLRYLDLSWNNFDGVHVPEFLGSLRNLRYLDLSLSYFSGRVPPQLGNLSNLRYFHLESKIGFLYSTDITWLSRLSSLEHLNMERVNLSTIVEWLPVVNMLPNLRFLGLLDCELGSSHSHPSSNLTSLEVLDISGNTFGTLLAPNWFWNVTTLKKLRLGGNQFHGPFPYEMGTITSIIEFDLSGNNLVGMIPPNLNHLCNLEMLDISRNNINGSIADLLERLPRCPLNKLQYLLVSDSNMTGSLPTSLQPLSNLTSLDLSNNMITGPIPLWMGTLTNLVSVDFSFNNLDGVIHGDHFARLENLQDLDLSENYITIPADLTWLAPSSVGALQLRSCHLGPKFPTWLRWQTHVDHLDISNTSLSDVAPDWFWIVASSIGYLNMRNNKISGTLPSTMAHMSTLAMDLSSNKFSGPLPKLPINLTYIDLSRNNLSGSLPSDIGAPLIEILILFDNHISGAIPSSLCKLQSLRSLDLSGNELSGPIPDCTANSSKTSMISLSIMNLSLRKNNLSGEFPMLLQSCQQLIFLDLSQNQFFGTLPAWIGEKLSSLVFLRLRHNMFYGHIPIELTKLIGLQYLDLGDNNFSGSITKSSVNFTGMIIKRDESDDSYSAITDGMSIAGDEMVDYTENFTVVTKGQERLYTDEIVFMVNLDLSYNNLTGGIPEVISTLVALTNLNLSWNSLSGQIPEKIGALLQLESLDLSYNELSCQIPNSITSLTYLSHMNLSYNNFSGRIPTGNQLQVLEDPASIYIGNIGLCGPPLANECSSNGDALTPADPKNHGDGFDKVSFHLSMIIGFVVGLLSVFYLMLFSRRWRNACYLFVDGLYDKMYVHVAVTWRKLRTRS